MQLGASAGCRGSGHGHWETQPGEPRHHTGSKGLSSQNTELRNSPCPCKAGRRQPRPPAPSPHSRSAKNRDGTHVPPPWSWGRRNTPLPHGSGKRCLAPKPRTWLQNPKPSLFLLPAPFQPTQDPSHGLFSKALSSPPAPLP